MTHLVGLQIGLQQTDEGALKGAGRPLAAWDDFPIVAALFATAMKHASKEAVEPRHHIVIKPLVAERPIKERGGHKVAHSMAKGTREKGDAIG
jgi:hypothetical protein